MPKTKRKPRNRNESTASANPKELGKKILGIREQLPGKVSQKRFADMLGVRRTTVSAWERGQNVPPAGAALRIAALISDPRRISEFLELAGVDQRATADLVVGFDTKYLASPEAGKVAAILPLAESSELRGEPSPDLLLQASILGSPSSKRYFIAPPGAATLGFEPDSILLLDVASLTLRSLLPFWDRRVLVEFRAQSPGAYEPALTYEVGKLVLGRPYRGAPGDFFTAELYQWSDAPPRPSLMPGLQIAAKTVSARLRAAGDEFGAKVAELAGPSPTAENLGYSMPVLLGTWEPSASETPPAHRPGRPEDAPEADRARISLRLKPGARILGRVIGWIEPQGREGKEP